MIKACFSSDMETVLSSMKGKTLKSIQGTFWKDMKSVFGNFRFELGQYAVDIECDLHPVYFTCFDGSKSLDDYAYFSCYKRTLKEQFKPFLVEEPVSFLINEKISEVLIVRDEIKTEYGEHILHDQSLIIKTSDKAYSFSTSVWFSEELDITVSDKIEGFQTVKAVKDFWGEDGKYKVDVNRQFIFL
jgi:hypothetical protein